jgi:hypothetical protein
MEGRKEDSITAAGRSVSPFSAMLCKINYHLYPVLVQIVVPAPVLCDSYFNSDARLPCEAAC